MPTETGDSRSTSVEIRRASPDPITTTAGYQSLPCELQPRVDGLVCSDDDRTNLTAILGAPEFRAMSTADKSKLLDVYTAAGKKGRSSLAILSTATMSRPSRIQSLDHCGKTLLSHAHSMATTTRSSRLTGIGITRREMLDDALSLAAMPTENEQGQRGLCTAASLRFALSARHPAELMRLADGLTSNSGTVKTRTGEELKLDKGSEAQGTGDQNSVARVLDAALMEFGNGDEYDYRYSIDKNRWIGNGNAAQRFLGDHWYDDTSGLSAKEMASVHEALFGKKLELITDKDKAREVLESSQAGQNTYLLMNWGDGNHAVNFLSVNDGVVMLRNPNGQVGEVGEITPTDPPRQIVGNGLERMTLEHVLENLIAVGRG